MEYVKPELAFFNQCIEIFGEKPFVYPCYPSNEKDIYIFDTKPYIIKTEGSNIHLPMFELCAIVETKDIISDKEDITNYLSKKIISMIFNGLQTYDIDKFHKIENLKIPILNGIIIDKTEKDTYGFINLCIGYFSE